MFCKSNACYILHVKLIILNIVLIFETAYLVFIKLVLMLMYLELALATVGTGQWDYSYLRRSVYY